MMGQKVPMISTTEVNKVELEFTNESMDTLNLQREVTPHAAVCWMNLTYPTRVGSGFWCVYRYPAQRSTGDQIFVEL